MKFSTRSIMMTAIAVVTTGTVVFAESVQPAPPPRPEQPVQLMADVQLSALTKLPPLLTVLRDNPLRLLGPAAPLGTLPPPPAPIQFAIAPNLANTVDAIYIAVEPWVQYGFEVATAIARWVPYVGWFAGLIMDGYFFGESLVASAVFNTTDFLRGDGGVAENLVDFGIDAGLAFVWLGLDALNTFIPLPPFCCYPPRPPVQGPFLAAASLLAPGETEASATAESVDGSEQTGDTEQLGNDEQLGKDEDQPVTDEEDTNLDVEALESGETDTDSETGTETDTVGTDEAALGDEAGLTDEEATDETTDTSDSVDAQGEVRTSDIEGSSEADTEDQTVDASSDDGTPDTAGEVAETASTGDADAGTTDDDSNDPGQ